MPAPLFCTVIVNVTLHTRAALTALAGDRAAELTGFTFRHRDTGGTLTNPVASSVSVCPRLPERGVACSLPRGRRRCDFVGSGQPGIGAAWMTAGCEFLPLEASIAGMLAIGELGAARLSGSPPQWAKAPRSWPHRGRLWPPMKAPEKSALTSFDCPRAAAVVTVTPPGRGSVRAPAAETMPLHLRRGRACGHLGHPGQAPKRRGVKRFNAAYRTQLGGCGPVEGWGRRSIEEMTIELPNTTLQLELAPRYSGDRRWPPRWRWQGGGRVDPWPLYFPPAARRADG